MNRLLNIFLCVWISGSVLAQDKPAVGDPQLLSVEGTVELLKAGGAEWIPVPAGTTLNLEDRVRTLKKSRAAIRLADASVLRMGEMTMFHLLPPKSPNEKPLIDLKSGSLYFFSRQKPDEVKFRTPTVSGAIRGTEFVVTHEEDSGTDLALLDGTVLLEAGGAETQLISGQRATIVAGSSPKTTPLLNAQNVIQWVLYYPAVVAPEDLKFSAEEQTNTAASIAAYNSGDLGLASRSLELPPTPTDDLLLYSAALDLGVGDVMGATEKIQRAAGHPAARALSMLISAVLMVEPSGDQAGDSASELLARSYLLQSQGQLAEALAAAQRAAAKVPEFGFAFARVAELQFAHGLFTASLHSLDHARRLSPDNAHVLSLQGYSLLAQGEDMEALRAFETAIRRDSSFGAAWLGRGIAAQELGLKTEARRAFETAAALEPQRALFRAYLARAFVGENSFALADKDFRISKALDPGDPTPWFYSGLADHQRNKINSAITNIQTAIDLNDNQQIFRSEFLLDQDRAARQASLASIYRDANMLPLGVVEASRSVTLDYGNYAAHRYLAQGYDLLSDRRKFSLRHEATRLSELYMAALLAPVDGYLLSQNLASQDSGRFFPHSAFGLSSLTEYHSDNEWLQTASQFGTFGSTAYSLDYIYRAIHNGDRSNNDLERRTASAQIKQRITSRDTIFFQALHLEAESGDAQELFDPAAGNLDIRVEEEHAPDLFLGYHREWKPGNHTLVLAGRLDSDLAISDPTYSTRFFRRNAAGQVASIGNAGLLNRNFRRDYEAYLGEVQQMITRGNNQFIVGARGQQGQVEADSRLLNPFGNAVTAENSDTDFSRWSGYGYFQRELMDQLHATVGLSYDYLDYPRNVDTSPISARQVNNGQLSPKIGIVYSPGTNSTLRAAFTRSLGGFSYENSIRLEPTQVAGFNQAFRSVMPENIVGSIPGEEFQTISLGYEHSFSNRTFLLVEAENLRSEANRYVGSLSNDRIPPVPNTALTARQDLDFQENSIRAHGYHLLGEYFTVAAGYRYSRASLDGRYQDAPVSVAGAVESQKAELHLATLGLTFNHQSGFFALGESEFYSQQNRNLDDDAFWQHHLYVGYRFLKRAAEVRIGVLNLADQDYRLNPLNVYADLPRERTFTARLRLNF